MSNRKDFITKKRQNNLQIGPSLYRIRRFDVGKLQFMVMRNDLTFKLVVSKIVPKIFRFSKKSTSIKKIKILKLKKQFIIKMKTKYD